jgi:phthiocerol/phenolphthiocerol synthesis type-I polyketide synthase E
MRNEISLNEQNNFDIAIIGMAGRFPGAPSIEKFWRNLRDGVESVTFFTEEELLEAGLDPALLKDPGYVKAAAMLDNPELFDASFFNYSPREAAAMDPQQRIFLECSCEALEQAGYDADRYPGQIGVFAGSSRNTYILTNNLIESFAARDLTTVMGNDSNFLTTRVSYKLNLKGPSITVGTGCSTSLVAVHLACQSLLNQECDMSLAGAVSVWLPQKSGYLYQQGGIVSPDGHCRAFDAHGQGTIFGSGAGVVLLKRLADAVSDGDIIHAVIKGSAINNDGNAKVSYTAPSVDGQTEVILEALANAGIEADTISYIEAHGTGTALGDPIEVTALTRAFRNYTDKRGFCAIGSGKTNIGHLDVAAGVTGLIKTVMALKHKAIPPTLHFTRANPEIDFPSSPFYVNTRLVEWPADSLPRRAGVSSFGVGGTNAHVILEEAPEISPSGKSRSRQLLLLSARTDTALETTTTNLVTYLKDHREVNLADVAYTLQAGRRKFSHRRTLVCQDIDDAIATLETRESQRVLDFMTGKDKRDTAFVFSGQGSQYVNMGRELYETETVFREQVDRCAEILKPHLKIDLRDIIYPDGPVTEEATQKLTQTSMTQPALFTIEYALAQLWMSWGVPPAAMVGHSIGEYVAACLAGVFSLEDALSVVAARGRLMQGMPEGSMLAVFLSEKEVRPLLDERLSLAVINGPSLCVISGEKEVIAALEKQLAEKKVACRHVHTSHAFHSRMMEPILSAFGEEVRKARLDEPQIPFLSNVTGTWITREDAANPDYWVRQVRQTVRFSDCLQELLKEPERVILEVGPGNTFSALARQHPAATKEHVILASTHHPKEATPDTAYILNTLGQLWMAGIEVDWAGFYKEESRHRVPLPTYPFERQPYWVETKKETRVKIEGDKTTLPVPEPVKKEPVSVSDDHGKDVEQTLIAIWQEALGVKKINTTDNFFDLGGTSLVAVGLFSEIERRIGNRLPLAILMTAPTIKELAEVIQDDKLSADWTSLVPIQPGNSRPPLFFIHAAGGNLLIYRDLIRRLGPEQPVYGLQAQGLDGEQPVLSRIEDMAKQYVKELKTVQPQGPYLLAGYCMGGTVAFEMAQQLRAQGQEVSLLALMETYNFSNQPQGIIDKIHYRIQQIEFHLRNFLLTDQKMTFLREKAKVAWGRKDIIFGSVISRISLRLNLKNRGTALLSSIWKACDLAAVNYVPKIYTGRITQFRPIKPYACFDGPEMGWEKLAAGGLDTYDLPVYPRGMLVEPFVELLADKLEYYIQKALE